MILVKFYLKYKLVIKDNDAGASFSYNLQSLLLPNH